MASKATFRELCCKQLGLPRGGFEEAVLWRCLPPYHLPVGKLQWRLKRAYFNNDLELIRSVADCISLGAIRAELAYYRSTKPDHGLRRGILRARLSGQRLVDLASTLLPSN
jgi:hypothetical protein